ncbi:FJX1 [Acanthosepion pharaonis]|uniref:FJX1 n=1 Tax=Acanthosepion pharaonis TaxID=158019 RepID=A0A812CIU0_ACAPH|nr:FJX1 [Sepia pharaonis]
MWFISFLFYKLIFLFTYVVHFFCLPAYHFGSSSGSLKKELEKIKKTHVHELKPPLWNKCGRPKNGFVILDDGSYMCARYRDPHSKLVFGEVLSFYLSRLLGLDNIPVVSLSQVNHSLLQWKGIDFNRLKWKEGNLVALIQWIPGISTVRSHVKMPEAIYNAYLQKEPLTGANLNLMKLNDTAISDIVQWGNMLIFDYLTGNYDRYFTAFGIKLQTINNFPSIYSLPIKQYLSSYSFVSIFSSYFLLNSILPLIIYSCLFLSPNSSFFSLRFWQLLVTLINTATSLKMAIMFTCVCIPKDKIKIMLF